MSQSRRILFQLSGSIACYKACDAISKLVQQGFEVQTVATKAALEFVGAATLEGLTGRAIYSDVFERGRAMEHIDFAKWADVAVVCPATAGTINALAAGLASDALTTLFLSYDLAKPYLVFPAMNHRMLSHPATAASLAKLEGWGVRVLPTDTGRQACGDEGQGRLLEPQRIVAEITAAFERTART